MNTTPVRRTALAFATLFLAACGPQENAASTAPEVGEAAGRVQQPPAAESHVAVEIDREKARALGVRTSQVKEAISEAFGDRPIPSDVDLTKITVRSMGGELVPLSSVATISLKAGSSEIQKADAAFLKEMKSAPAAAADDPAAYEAWFKKHGLDLNDPKMLDADADGDGVSNRDEFLAGTDPRAATSHPDVASAHPALRFKEYNEVRLPLVLDSVRGEKAVIRNGDANETVRVGDTIRGFPLRVTKVSERQTTDKEGARTDRSQVLLEDPTTKERVTLVKDLPAKTSATHAVLTPDEGKTWIKVHAGEIFSWPGDPGVSYRVLDLGRDQIVIQQQETRKMWTLPRE